MVLTQSRTFGAPLNTLFAVRPVFNKVRDRSFLDGGVTTPIMRFRFLGAIQPLRLVLQENRVPPSTDRHASEMTFPMLPAASPLRKPAGVDPRY